MRLSPCVIPVLFVMFLSGCGAVMPSDGWNHFAFSASVASLGTAATSRPLESAGVTVGLGLVKEMYDQWRGGGFEASDLLADIAGALLGGYAAAEICMEDFP